MKMRILVCSSVILFLICSLVFASAGNVGQGIDNPTENFNHQVEIEPVFEISRSLRSNILNILLAQFEERKKVSIELHKVKCGILGNWRRIAYFDTTQGDSCPTGLRTVTNNATNQTACGRTGTVHGCTSLTFLNTGSYTRVCGKVRGYQHGDTQAFFLYNHLSPKTIENIYSTGISITQGSPRQHLWTYAAGVSESSHGDIYACPCARSDYNQSWIPKFVGNNYYCEAGFNHYFRYKTVWGDPLWDGDGCFAASNTCCNRYGWFYREVQASSKYVEVRLCGRSRYTASDVPLDHLEIWVM